MEEEKKEREAFAAAPLVVKDENGEDVTLYILEETKLNGCYYILAADSEEEDGRVLSPEGCVRRGRGRGRL